MQLHFVDKQICDIVIAAFNYVLCIKTEETGQEGLFFHLIINYIAIFPDQSLDWKLRVKNFNYRN